MKNSLKAASSCVAAILLSSFLALPADAGFLTVDCAPVGGLPDPAYWGWGHKPNGNDAWMHVTESFEAEYGDSYGLLVSGTTNGDPILTITKNITNTTGFAWIGYNIDLDPFDTDTFFGTPTSDKMTLVGQTLTSLDFGLPVAVLPGQSVQFVFDVNVPDIGPFGFTLTQSPVLVPEPATMSLAGLAALLIAGAAGRKRLA